MMSSRAATYLIAIALCLVPRATRAQHVTEHDPGVVSVKADGVPLGQVLRELTSLAQFSRLRIDPSADECHVTVALDAVPLHHAIVEVLRSANVDFVFAGSSSGQPFRLMAAIFEASATAPEAHAAATSAGPTAVGQPDDSDQSERDGAARADAAKTDRSVAALAGALSAPAVSPQALGFVTLPFPDASGAPGIQVVTPGVSKSALPFPVATPAASQAPLPTANAPLPPELKRFNEAVAPTPSGSAR